MKGYYVDVGCSQLIIDGKVKIKQGQGIERFEETGVRFKDGSLLEADIVVLATGMYDPFLLGSQNTDNFFWFLDLRTIKKGTSRCEKHAGRYLAQM